MHMVQDAEVGYAVLYCSTDDYCNPSKDVSHLLSMPLQTQSLAQAGTEASQVVGSQASRQPPTKKPEVNPAVSRNPAASNKNIDSLTKEPSSSEEGKSSKDANSSKMKNQGVFTVPESLIDETLGSKGATRVAGGRSVSHVPVESIKEEPDVSRKSFNIPSESGDAMVAESKGKVTGNVLAQGQQIRSQLRARVHEDTAVEALSAGKRQARSRSPVSINQKRLTETGSTTGLHSRSSAKSSIATDTELSPTVSQPTKHQKPAVVKIEDDSAATHNPASTSASAVLFDSEMPAASEIKREQEKIPPDSKPVNLLDDEDEIQPRRQAPSRNKRRHHDVSSEEDDENPFDFLKKRPKKSPSPKPLTTRSPSPAPETPPRSPPPAPKWRHTKVLRSASPGPGSHGKAGSMSRGSDDADEAAVQVPPPAEPHAAADTKSLSQVPSQSTHFHNGHGERGSSSGGPVPYGFLTTRQPIKDQVDVNANFEQENIETPAVLVEFENLVVRRARASHQEEDQSDVPKGMARWKGKLVRNVKRFTKVRHTGADRLPTIIGGRDLEEHCGASRKVMEDWLKELQDAESQQTQREREAQELFDWQPPTRGSRSRR